ncbi:MAG: hypothetical protein G01um101413_169 [Parcubacteria group bacterium Gr01-1014_13]|nr:MAG: hypothetical protein G01um101413_169 [Parcubacteria group bacterium Gr01-1014_13]
MSKKFCKQCNGTGRSFSLCGTPMTCSKCGGKGVTGIICGPCYGTGRTFSLCGTPMDCSECEGTGKP